MKIPTIEGIIDRRILINYLVDKEILENILPSPFKPKLIDGMGMAGICLIRLKNIRLAGLPAFMGIGSENAAHRIAVEWNEGTHIREGVYIPRRDTNSILNHLAGGRVFPGVHHLSEFLVDEPDDSYHITINHNKSLLIDISAKRGTELNKSSVFKSLEEASTFFKNGSIGFSPNRNNYDGLELKPMKWEVMPLEVENVYSHLFEDTENFPKGSFKFDNALAMHNIRHLWNNYANCPCPED